MNQRTRLLLLLLVVAVLSAALLAIPLILSDLPGATAVPDTRESASPAGGPTPSAATDPGPATEATPAIIEAPGPGFLSPAQAALAAAVDDTLAPLAESGRFSGSVLVARQGEIVLKKGYGLADWSVGAPNSPATIFRIGSLTKAFTALAVLQLAESGRLAVDDPLSASLPDYPGGEDITLHQLLGHTAGVPDHTRFPGFINTLDRPHTVAELIATFAGRPLDFPPGSRFAYSNSNYVLLGAVIEAVSGQSYESYLSEHIFQPLRLRRSGYDHNNLLLDGRALGYRPAGSAPQLAEYIDMSIPYAAGALYSTVEELYIWDQALRGDKVLGPAWLARMFTPNQGGYGYGWYINDDGPHLAAEHAGLIFGYESQFVHYLTDDSAIILLSNLESGETRTIVQRLKGLLYPP